MSSVSIILPTYNRSKAIEYYLEKCVFKDGDDICLYIHDSSDNNKTKEKVDACKKKSAPRLRYFRHPKEIDPDTKMFEAIKMADTDYIWLVSDGAVIDIGNYRSAIKPYLDIGYDIVNLDTSDPYKLENIDYTEEIDFFKDCFWSVTGYGSTIIKRNVFQRVFEPAYEQKIKQKYSQRAAFLWPCMIFELISDQGYRIMHLKNKYFYLNPYKKASSWLTSGCALEIWVDTLIEDVEQLPEKYTQYREVVLKSVWANTGLDSIKKQLAMRSFSCITYKKIRERDKKGNLDRVTDQKRKLYFVSFVPIGFTKIINVVYHRFKERKKCIYESSSLSRWFWK